MLDAPWMIIGERGADMSRKEGYGGHRDIHTTIPLVLSPFLSALWFSFKSDVSKTVADKQAFDKHGAFIPVFCKGVDELIIIDYPDAKEGAERTRMVSVEEW